MRKAALVLLALIMVKFIPVTNASYVPYQEEWGIYKLDQSTGETEIIYSSPYEITFISINDNEDMIAFSMNIGDGYDYSEIFIFETDCSNLTQLTDNNIWDIYPVWSPNGEELIYLSRVNDTLDIWKMKKDGTGCGLLYDSGGHDADIDWRADKIVFTRDSQIWIMNSDGNNPHRITSPPRAGEWSNAPFPFGDYDPRISPDGSRIVYERLVNDVSPHGNYELYVINTDGSDEHPLTDTGWTQGMATWSSTGNSLVYLVSAMGTEGKYDLYRINIDGSNITDLTSQLYPPGFLAHSPILSKDDTVIYFVGQWWDWKKLETSITCSNSIMTPAIGEEIIISGRISPTVYPINITFTIDNPNHESTKKSVCAINGSCSFQFKVEQIGTYEIYAEWNGDKGHYGCTSKTTSFTVVESGSRQKLPGFPLIFTFIGISWIIFHRMDYKNKAESDNKV